MSYENPQTVIDTESAKYYAQAISNLGLSAAKMIDAEGERKRKEALENKKRNLTDSKNRTKYNQYYLSLIDKGLADAGQINLKPHLKPLLNKKINEAVDIKIMLDNFNGTANERMGLQNELNALETFFNSGMEEGLNNFANQIESISEGNVNGGQEGSLSYSHNNSFMISDMMSTQQGLKTIPYGVDIVNVDGAYNIQLDFMGEKEEKGKHQTILDESGKARDLSRTYNLNRDFSDGDLIVNPNLTSVVQKTMQDLQYITKGGAINTKGPISSIYSDKVKTKNINGKTYYFPQVDGQLLYNKIYGSIESAVSGIIKQGRAGDGDQAYGLLVMQSFVDDILPDEIDKSIGRLEPDPTTVSGINQEQFEKIATWLNAQQHAQLNVKMVPDDDLAPAGDGGGSSLTANQQLTQDILQKSYDEAIEFVDDFVEDVFPHNRVIFEGVNENKMIESLQKMGLVITGKKPGNSYMIKAPHIGKEYLISPNSSSAQNKESVLNALGRKQLMIDKPAKDKDKGYKTIFDGTN